MILWSETTDREQRTENLTFYKQLVVNGAVPYSTVQYSTVQYSTVQYSTVQYSEHSTVLLHHVLPLCVHTGGKSAYCVPGKQHTEISDTGFSVLSEN